jgi:acetylornithine deacetylase/succinyl-diaminopimelate desuccinylase-like protein
VAASEAVLGTPTPFGYMAGVSDANLTCGEAGIPTILYGPLAGDFHQCTEWVDISTIAPCAEVVLSTALTMLRGQRS